MSKYIILIIFISFSFTFTKDNTNSNILKAFSDEAEDVTSYLIEFFYGLVGNVTNSKCIANLQKQRQEFNHLINEIMGLQGDLHFDKFVSDYGFKIIKMPGFIKDCKLAFLFRMYFMFRDEKKIQEVGQAIVNNSKEIYDSINGVVENGESIFKAIGTILRISFGLKFS